MTRLGRHALPLGLGLATLMREPSEKRRQRLLQIAYEAGYRHFDVAPSYGLGLAESTLGRFLQSRPGDVTIATKVGIRAHANKITRVVQRPVRSLLRKFPALRGRATAAIGSVVHSSPDFSRDSCTRSLENSLRVLRVAAIDLLLLHEARPVDLDDGAVLEWLEAQKSRGLVRHVGIATTAAHATAILRTHGQRLDVIQVPSHILAPASEVLQHQGLVPITHGVIAAPLGILRQRQASDTAWAAAFKARTGLDLTDSEQAARFLVAGAIADNPRGIVLIGTSNADHLTSAARAVSAFTSNHVKDATQFLRASFAEVKS